MEAEVTPINKYVPKMVWVVKKNTAAPEHKREKHQYSILRHIYGI